MLAMKKPKRIAVLTALISALSLPIAYVLKFRTTLIAWALDPRIVGFELPTFALDFIHAVASDARPHIDTRKTIAAAIIAYFKSLFARGTAPRHADFLFAELETHFNAAKTTMGPTFCQLLRPKFCRQLAQRDPVYKELTPPASLLPPYGFGELAMPRRGDWQGLYDRYIETFIGPSLLSKDEHLLQLVVQVLAKIGLRGGKVSEQVSKFVTKSFAKFIPQDASQILVGFQVKFCIVEPHQVFNEMIDGFIGIFAKLRQALDTVITSQLKAMWTNDVTYDRSAFDPIRSVFGMVTVALDDVILKKKEKEDIRVANALAKRILPALDGDQPPAIQFMSFTTLRTRVALLANDSLAAALAGEPGEESMAHIVEFLLTATLDLFQVGTVPFLDVIFHKNDKFLTPALIRRLAELSEQLATLPQLHNLLRTPIQNALEANKADVDTLLPLLRKFGHVDEFIGRKPIIFHSVVQPAESAFRCQVMPMAAKGFAASSFHQSDTSSRGGIMAKTVAKTPPAECEAMEKSVMMCCESVEAEPAHDESGAEAEEQENEGEDFDGEEEVADEDENETFEE
jgi:hypothetical protein